MSKKQYEKNVELDAQMVQTAMYGGIDAIVALAFKLRHIFSSPDDALHRAEWLKKQNEEYIRQVSDRVVELESKCNVGIVPNLK